MLQKAYALSGPVILATVLIGLAQLRRVGPTAEISPHRINVAQSTATTFAPFDGAGRGLVARIGVVKRFAGLRSIADLRWVPGIGARRLHAWWPWLTDDGPDADEHVAWRR